MVRQSSRLAEARAMRDEYPDEDHQQAFADGYDFAHGIACHCRPEVGDTVDLESEGEVEVDEENWRDIWEQICYEGEANARQYSPWEQIAARINASDDAESLWEAYDAGVAAAIAHDTEDAV